MDSFTIYSCAPFIGACFFHCFHCLRAGVEQSHEAIAKVSACRQKVVATRLEKFSSTDKQKIMKKMWKIYFPKYKKLQIVCNSYCFSKWNVIQLGLTSTFLYGTRMVPFWHMWKYYQSFFSCTVNWVVPGNVCNQIFFFTINHIYLQTLQGYYISSINTQCIFCKWWQTGHLWVQGHA